MSYLLWILGGFVVLGLHRFYLGRWVTGLIWLLTGGLLGIGAIIDLFVIPPMVQVENLSRQLLSQAQGKKPQMDTDGQREVERESVRSSETPILRPQASSLPSPQMNTDRAGKPDLRLREGPGGVRKARRHEERAPDSTGSHSPLPPGERLGVRVCSALLCSRSPRFK